MNKWVWQVLLNASKNICPLSVTLCSIQQNCSGLWYLWLKFVASFTLYWIYFSVPKLYIRLYFKCKEIETFSEGGKLHWQSFHICRRLGSFCVQGRLFLTIISLRTKFQNCISSFLVTRENLTQRRYNPNWEQLCNNVRNFQILSCSKVMESCTTAFFFLFVVYIEDILVILFNNFSFLYRFYLYQL